MRITLIIALGLVSLGAIVQSAMADEKPDCVVEYRRCIRGAIANGDTNGPEVEQNGIETCISFFGLCMGWYDPNNPQAHTGRLPHGGGGNLKDIPGGAKSGTKTGYHPPAGPIAGAAATFNGQAQPTPVAGSGAVGAGAGTNANAKKAATPQKQNVAGNVLGSSGILGADRLKLHAN